MDHFVERRVQASCIADNPDILYAMECLSYRARKRLWGHESNDILSRIRTQCSNSGIEKGLQSWC